MSGNDASTTLPLQDLLAQRNNYSPTQESAPGNGPWPGAYRGLRHGQGLDFDELRQYIPGDDIRHIDWKVTARRNETYTRLYREEKERVLTVALDFRSPMFTGTQSLRAVTAGKLAAQLIWQATALGNRCNLQILCDSTVHSLPPSTSTNGALNACKLIADTFKQSKNNRDTHAQASMTPLLNRLLDNGRFTGSVLFVSAGDNPGSSLDSLLPTLARSAAVAWILVEDDTQWQALPKGQYGYKLDNKKRHIRIDKTRATQLNNLIEEQKTTFFNRLQHSGVKTLSTSDGMDAIRHRLQQWQFLA